MRHVAIGFLLGAAVVLATLAVRPVHADESELRDAIDTLSGRLAAVEARLARIEAADVMVRSVPSSEPSSVVARRFPLVYPSLAVRNAMEDAGINIWSPYALNHITPRARGLGSAFLIESVLSGTGNDPLQHEKFRDYLIRNLSDPSKTIHDARGNMRELGRALSAVRDAGRVPARGSPLAILLTTLTDIDAFIELATSLDEPTIGASVESRLASIEAMVRPSSFYDLYRPALGQPGPPNLYQQILGGG